MAAQQGHAPDAGTPTLGRTFARLLPFIRPILPRLFCGFLCALAAGWVDLYFEGPLGEWDFAAGLLIATEAGVATSGLRGRPAGVELVAGAHPERAEEFFALLTSLGVAETG